MSRRGESGFDLLVSLPWQATVALAAVLGIGAPFAAAKMSEATPILAHSQSALTAAVRLLAGLCLLAAAVSFFRKWLLARKFHRQRSLEDLRNLTWQQFERIVGEAFRHQGYGVAETGLGGADGGVDLILTKDRNRYLVQCKHYRSSQVGVQVVREIFGVVAARRAAGALVVTTGQFTREAVGFARGQPIELIDGARLEAMVRAIHAGAPNPSHPGGDSAQHRREAAPSLFCPRCSSAMVLRQGRGTRTSFYGCSTYPTCRGTRAIP